MDKKIIIAHYFMAKSREQGRTDFTNKKLQKLMFYAQAWSLVLNNQPIIDDKFEAWIHGAAIPALYRVYKDYGWSNITEAFDTSEFSQLTNEERELLDDVWTVYGQNYDADYLELLNHSEEPWQKARQDVAPFESSNAEISEAVMKEFYGRKLEEAQA